MGQHRSTKRFATLVIGVKLVENLRPKVCYHPGVLVKIYEHYAQAYAPAGIEHLTQEFVEQLCTTLPYWQAHE